MKLLFHSIKFCIKMTKMSNFITLSVVDIKYRKSSAFSGNNHVEPLNSLQGISKWKYKAAHEYDIKLLHELFIIPQRSVRQI